MKPFRTNKKDREKFARVLGFTATRFYICMDTKNDDSCVLSELANGWSFVEDGFQETVSRIIKLGYEVEFDSIWAEIGNGRFALSCVQGKSVGERLFRAVVKLEESK